MVCTVNLQTQTSRLFKLCVVLLCLAHVEISSAKAEAPATSGQGLPISTELAAALERDAPQNVEELQLIQQHIRSLVEKVVPCTVGVSLGAAQGSGVIVSADGYVLTAGHVSGKPGRNVKLVLHDGRIVQGKTLGANQGIDSGLIKITDEGPWPFVEMGSSTSLKTGQWCLTTGHPGGYKPGRPPVVRLGRVLLARNSVLATDCTLVGGDSGGPLFDMQGLVIGIHSRIGQPLEANFHVPVATYRDTWDRLATGEWWGRPVPPGGPYVGISGDPEAEPCKISMVSPNSPAASAGIQVGDIIRSFAGQPVRDFAELAAKIAKYKPEDKVELEIMRGEEALKLNLTIGKRPN